MKFLLVIAFVLNLLCSTGECREIVFVLNEGQSMSRSDPSKIAPESVLWGMESLSDKDEAKLITFADDTGAALNRVLDNFSSKSNVERHIILITDGDHLVDALSTNRANSMNVPIHVLNVSADPDVMTAMRTLIHKNIRGSSVEFLTNAISSGKLPIELPELDAERLRVLLISSSVGDAKLLNAEHQTLVDGRFVKAYELERPDIRNFVLDVDYPPGTGLTVDIVAERNGLVVFPIDDLPWLLGGGAIASIVLLSIPLIKRHRAVNGTPYRGKLLIQLTKTDGEDDPEPREFNLFRSPAVELNLREILNKCSIFAKFEDAEAITISPDAQGITLKNNSSCTVTKRNDLVKRGGRVELWYNDTVNISTEDDSAELILIYKTMKPNGELLQ
ncbi:MAG: VWA domain-containing protein [Selenomonadaceae bacterium]|nr:VWA domain-containing protein [Selenomonadaceae bacterium]